MKQAIINALEGTPALAFAWVLYASMAFAWQAFA